MPTQISDVIVPEEFTQYLVQNTMVASALFQSGVLANNDVVLAQLAAGADMFNVPYWNDLSDDEADIVNDNPSDIAAAGTLNAVKQAVRKSFLHKGWSTMNLASELSGSDAMARVRERATAYWTRQGQKRLISMLMGIKAHNIANDGGDMIHDASTETIGATQVIDAAGTLGDAMGAFRAIAMHSDLYKSLLKQDLIEYIRDSDGSLVMTTYRGLAVTVDDGLVPDESGVYTSVLFAAGAIGYGSAEPRIAAGTEIENLPGAGNGGGQQILHTRVNLAFAPLGYGWTEASVAKESPSIAELAIADNWKRTAAERKQVPIAFLLTKGEAAAE
ncbi:major capsid protein [Klebsiella pneumoniae]